jgi:hypothetical protein
MDTLVDNRSTPSPRPASEKKATLALTHAVQSGLFLFFMVFILYFTYLIFHEGGHALYILARGGVVEIYYVHPFSFSGYVRPFAFFNDPWFHAAGPLLGILGPLLISLPLWKKRSTTLLPLVMAFPWVAILQGVSFLMGGGDSGNISRLTGISPMLFQGFGFLLLCLGMFLLFTLLPLMGLNPRDWKAMLILPLAIVLWSGIGFAVGLICVPGSPIAVRYDLTEELLSVVHMTPITSAFMGILLGGLYVSLFRWIQPHMPTSLRSEVATISWKDLLLPGLLAATSVVAGLLIIT